MQSRPSSSSSSSGNEKIFREDKIQRIYFARIQAMDLFDELLCECSMVPEELQSSSTINNLNLSPRQHSNQGCKCAKIGCLKLYCECFSKGKLCNSSCICIDCHNTAGNEDQITHAKGVVNYRQPGYFHGVPEYIPVRKCTCKKSLCRKKYCECFNAGLKCTEDCECINCHNEKPQIHVQFNQHIEIEVSA